jgi:intein/homing endonuclease
MIFNKKNKDSVKCENCGSKTNEKHSFCPHCGNSFVDSTKDKDDFGLLGKSDFTDENFSMPQEFGITDKLINSIFNSMMKNIDKQFKDQFKDMEKNYERTEVESLPNNRGIRIKIAGPFESRQKTKPAQNILKRSIREEQLKKIGSFPRIKAKTNVKRVGDKIVYELTTPGVSSPQDIFISKLESGYEIKAIGSNKVYVNSVPINLPLKKYSILKNKLSVEFASQENQQ